MGERAKGDGKKIRGYSIQQNTYDGVPIIWANLETFSTMFLETKYKLEYYRLQRVKDKEYPFTKDEIRFEKQLTQRLKDLYEIMVSTRVRTKKLYQSVDSFSPGINCDFNCGSGNAHGRSEWL